MLFEIPETLTQFSIAGLEDLASKARTEYTALKTSLTPDTVTAEQMDDLKTLRQFAVVDVPAEIEARATRKAEFSALDEKPAEKAEDEKPADGDKEPDKAADKEPDAVTASAKVEDTKAPSIADIKRHGGGTESKVPAYEPARYSTLVAAAGVGGYQNDQTLDGMLDVAKVFIAQSQGHGRSGLSSNGPVHYPVAILKRNYPDEFSVNWDEGDYGKLLSIANEERLPGGSLLAAADLRREQIKRDNPNRDSLVAAAGWCAPSETDYDICLQITTDGLADFPEVQARRGGIRHNTGIEFDSIFGTGTGFFDLTEAQVAAGVTKTCLEIPCPDFVDTRLGVTGLCLTGNILSIRGYPEFTATFTRGAVAASAHQINREQISDVVAGSTSVDLTAFAPWATDGSTVSQVMSAAEMAAVDIKYRLRMQRSGTLEAIFPFWILAQMRADWIRRNGGDYQNTLTLADSAIMAAFRERGVRPQFVYDWQDAFSNVPGTGAGADTPITSFNKSLQFLMYPAGTWVRAVNDVITLNSVYDSTKLATNQVTHLFTETGWAMLKMCPVSRVYTVPICPSGKTTSLGTLTCP